MMTYFYFPVSGEMVAKDGSVTKADDDMLCDYHKMIEFAMYTVQSQTYFWETELFSDVKGDPEKHAMRYTHHRGLAAVTRWVRLKFAAMNLKKLANWSWKNSISTFL